MLFLWYDLRAIFLKQLNSYFCFNSCKISQMNWQNIKILVRPVSGKPAYALVYALGTVTIILELSTQIIISYNVMLCAQKILLSPWTFELFNTTILEHTTLIGGQLNWVYVCTCMYDVGT